MIDDKLMQRLKHRYPDKLPRVVYICNHYKVCNRPCFALSRAQFSADTCNGHKDIVGIKVYITNKCLLKSKKL